MRNNYKNLKIWQLGIEIANNISDILLEFPKHERYDLSSQLSRCSVSIPSNIAEGYGRHSTGDYKRFLQIAVGSLFELQTQVEIAFNLKYLAKDKFDTILGNTKELDRMLLSLIKKI